MAAIVAGVNENGTVDLHVFPPGGNILLRTSVPLRQEGEPAPESDYAELPQSGANP